MNMLPTVRFGYVFGPVRWESLDNWDYFEDHGYYDRILVNEGERPIYAHMCAVTHLQKKSRFGFLIFKPFIFHIWFTWRFQKQERHDDGAVVWVPGSERVTYGRTPGLRFDFAQGKYIRSRGYFSFTHWD